MREGFQDYDYTRSKRANASNDNTNTCMGKDQEVDITHLFALREFLFIGCFRREIVRGRVRSRLYLER